jgi:hypothetical protein
MYRPNGGVCNNESGFMTVRISLTAEAKRRQRASLVMQERL